MNTGDSPISWLMFFTLGGGVVIIALGFIWHLRSQRNRDIASEALLQTEGGPKGDARGALPDLLGFAVFALIAMALLTAGYAQKSRAEKYVAPSPVGSTSR